ncbi:MAG: 5'-nucleotidase C-terminal domain-containing protein [Acidobacteriota bacterium]
MCLLTAPAHLGAQAAPTEPARDAAEQRELTLLVTSGLSGRLVDDGRTVADLVAAVRAEAERVRADGGTAVVLDAGRAFAPYAESRSDRGAVMSRALEAAGAVVVVPHLLDLAATRSAAMRRAKKVVPPRLRGFDLPSADDLPSAEDLSSAKDSGADSDDGTDSNAPAWLGDERILVPAGDLKLEVRALWDDGLVDDLTSYEVAATARALDTLEPPPRTLQLTVVHAKATVAANGAFGLPGAGSRLTWELVQRPRGRDLLIDPDLGQDLALRAVAADSDEPGDGAEPVALVGRRLDTIDPWTFARVDLALDVLPDGDVQVRAVDLEVHHLDKDQGKADDRGESAERANLAELADLADSARTAFDQFRNTYARPLPDGGPQSYGELVCFTLDAMRRATGAEIAVLDQRALRPIDPAYLTGALREEAVQRLLPIDHWLVVRELDGDELLELVEATLETDRTLATARLDDACGNGTDQRAHENALITRGIHLDDEIAAELSADGASGVVDLDSDDLEINGRPLYPADRYRVVTSRFLGQGGHGYARLQDDDAEDLTDPGAKADLDQAPELRRVVTDALRETPRRLDLEARPLWRFGIKRVTLDFDGVDVDADPAYEAAGDSRARADSSSSLLGTLRLFADQERRSLRWENRLRARFGLVDTEGATESELADDLRLEVSAVFIDVTWLGGNPYASYSFDSELRRDRSASGGRLPRQHLESLSAGLDWSAPRWPRLRLGVLGQRQDDVEEIERWGALGEAQFQLGDDDSTLRLDARLAGEALRDGDVSQTRLELDLRLLVRLRDRLDLAPGLELYRFEDSRLPGAADYRRLSLGLSWSWIGKRQR